MPGRVRTGPEGPAPGKGQRAPEDTSPDDSDRDHIAPLLNAVGDADSLGPEVLLAIVNLVRSKDRESDDRKRIREMAAVIRTMQTDVAATKAAVEKGAAFYDRAERFTQTKGGQAVLFALAVTIAIAAGVTPAAITEVARAILAVSP